MTNKSWEWLIDFENQTITPEAQRIIEGIIADAVQAVDDKYKDRIEKLEAALRDMKFSMRNV